MTKSQLLAELADVKRELAERRLAGLKLSNAAYIASLPGVRMDKAGRAQMGRLAREWDAIARSGDDQ
jgi:hypothetical protein